MWRVPTANRNPELSVKYPCNCILSSSTPISSNVFRPLRSARYCKGCFARARYVFFINIIGKHYSLAAVVVRKAYKKKALETHPDRLPPGATLDQKTASEDKFRKVYFIYAMCYSAYHSQKVNNAYEVLNDPKKRNVCPT